MKILTLKDDSLVADVAQIPLYYRFGEQQNRLWLDHKLVEQEYFFDDLHHFDFPQKRTMVLEKQMEGKLRNMLGDMSHPFLQNPHLIDFMFQPTAWFSDSLQERSLAYRAAQLAEGKVLVLGLRMAIFPQFCQFLEKNSTQICIVEPDKDLIDLFEQAWQKPDTVQIVHSDYADFLKENTQVFDFIYVHCWRGFHHNFLPYINFLTDLAKKSAHENTQFLAAGYGFMSEDFAGLCWQIEKENLEKFVLDAQTDLLLVNYLDWRKTQNSVQKDQVHEKAFQIIQTTVSPILPNIDTESFLAKYF